MKLRNSKLPLITKLFGYLLGDGNIYISNKKGRVCAYGSEEDLKTIENDIRDLINWVEVWNEEEKEGGTKKIENEEAKKINEKLRAIATKLGIATL